MKDLTCNRCTGRGYIGRWERGELEAPQLPPLQRQRTVRGRAAQSFLQVSGGSVVIRRLLAKIRRQPAYLLDHQKGEPTALKLRTGNQEVLCDPLLSSNPNPKQGRLFKL